MKHLGYLMIDHRASPGLPEDVARWAGYDPKYCGEGKVFEASTVTCAHCKTPWVLNPLRTRERAKCFACDNQEGSYICDGCDFLRHQPDYVHAPFAKRIDDHLTAVSNPCADRSLPGTPLGSPTKLIS